MRRFEGFGDLCGDRQRVFDCHRPLADEVRQRRPLDQFKHERLGALGLAFGFFKPVDMPDVGVIEAGEDLGFALEAGQAVGVGRERFREIG